MWNSDEAERLQSGQKLVDSAVHEFEPHSESAPPYDVNFKINQDSSNVRAGTKFHRFDQKYNPKLNERHSKTLETSKYRYKILNQNDASFS